MAKRNKIAIFANKNVIIFRRPSEGGSEGWCGAVGWGAKLSQRRAAVGQREFSVGPIYKTIFFFAEYRLPSSVADLLKSFWSVVGLCQLMVGLYFFLIVFSFSFFFWWHS